MKMIILSQASSEEKRITRITRGAEIGNDVLIQCETISETNSGIVTSQSITIARNKRIVKKDKENFIEER